MAAIDVEKNLVVGVSSIPFGNCKWYNKADVVRLFKLEHGTNICEDEVEYVYDKQYCKSCFDPLIAIRGNRYYLNLEQIVTN